MTNTAHAAAAVAGRPVHHAYSDPDDKAMIFIHDPSDGTAAGPTWSAPDNEQGLPLEHGQAGTLGGHNSGTSYKAYLGGGAVLLITKNEVRWEALA